MSANLVIADLQARASKTKAFDLQRFFQTGPGQYGEGDLFIGVVVPEIRKVAATHKELPFTEIAKLVDSPIHEVRMCGLFILSNQYKKLKGRDQKKKYYDFFVKSIKAGNVNNWDLIDVNAPIIGEYLLESDDPLAVLATFAKSKNLWERRVAIIFTFSFIRVGQLDLTIAIAKLLLKDDHDLIHKGVGWMLREAGKRDVMLLRKFLTEHAHEMPRTMLRYAIEKLPEQERKKWLVESRH
ncbi:COG4912 Predicted DNA alkylation repair enzyme [Candidatus Nanopelagicaceae bacterium]